MSMGPGRLVYMVVEVCEVLCFLFLSEIGR